MKGPLSCTRTGPLRGTVSVPGDKSISHRLAMLAALAEGESRIRNYSTGADCRSTLGCLAALGVEMERTPACLVIRGHGLAGLKAPADTLDAGNSGSTIRMLSGIISTTSCPSALMPRIPRRRAPQAATRPSKQPTSR